MLLNIFLLFSIASLAPVFAASSSATSTSTAPAATWTVAVGAEGFNFSPHELNASVGDTIEWLFYPQNHSVVRGGFSVDPCIPYELTGYGLVGFWSGFKPVQLVLPNPPSFSVVINDTEPLSFYCSAPGACLQGMIGVINPNATFNWASQFALTQNATVELSPGESFPAETGKPIRTTTATGASFTPTPVAQTSSSSTSTTTSVATTSAPATPAAGSSTSLSTGAIVGIAIGGLAVVILAAALLYMCGRQKTVKEIRQSQQTPLNNSYQPSSPGFSEANYSNMHKPPFHDLNSPGHSPYTAAGTERSMSPPADERTQMMGMIPATHHYNGHPIPSSFPVSPGFPSPGFPSPTYANEMDHGSVGGMRPYNPTEVTEHDLIPQDSFSGPHEMAVPSRNPSTGNPPARTDHENRPFSYTDSESGYRNARSYPLEKNDSELR